MELTPSIAQLHLANHHLQPDVPAHKWKQQMHFCLTEKNSQTDTELTGQEKINILLSKNKLCIALHTIEFLCTRTINLI